MSLLTRRIGLCNQQARDNQQDVMHRKQNHKLPLSIRTYNDVDCPEVIDGQRETIRAWGTLSGRQTRKLFRNGNRVPKPTSYALIKFPPP